MQQMDGRKTCTYSSLAGPQKTTRQVTGDDLHAKSPQAVYRPTQDVVSMRKAIVAKESMCSCCSDVANNASVSVNTSNEE